VHAGWSSKRYDENKWLEQHQGLVINGKHWFCSQLGGTIRRCEDNTVDRPRIGATLNTVSVPGAVQNKYTHLGEIEWARVQAFAGFAPGLLGASGGAKGLILAAMEQDGDKYWSGTSLAFRDDMSGFCPEASSPLLYPAAYLNGPPVGQTGPLFAQRSCPWIALNPWDGLLYSAPFNPAMGPNGGILIHAYDVNDRVFLTRSAVQNHEAQYRVPLALFDALDTDSDGVIWAYRFVRAVELGAYLQRIQGGCFSNNGFLYLVNDVAGNHGVWRFSMLSGALLDVIGVDKEGGDFQECEGICLYGADAAYAIPPYPSPGETFVCATVWEWDTGDDIVWLKDLKLGPFVS